jgi:hypothetical protein
MSAAEIFVIIFFSTLTVILYSFCFWLKSKHGQRWMEKNS